jgi:ankyrin repeat protein
MIAAKTLTLSQIDEMTRDKESELVGAALSLIIKANPLHQKQNQIDFLRVAAEYGNRRVCEMLLESGEPLTEEERGQLLSIAAESRNPLLLQLLLASGPISEQAKGSALEKAAHCNHIDIVKTLLNSGTISSDCIGYVLYRSAEHDRLEIVKLILANPERISPNAWKSSSHVAAEEGRLDVVKALLASGKLTAEMKEEAFIGALDHDHFDVAQYLLNDAEIATSDNRATLVCVAADCGALEIMNEYLAQEVLADNWKALAITNAVLKGHLPIVQVLLAKGPLEPSFIQESIALADKKGHTEISLLLKDFIRANS